MRKLLLLILVFLAPIFVFGQYKVLKIDTIAPNKKTLTLFTRKVKADSLITTGLPVNSSPDSVITVGSDQLVSKTATVDFTDIAVDITDIEITTKDAGSVFFKQTSTGNFSASNKFYFDSTNTRICIGGTGVSHSPQSRLSILADSSRTATKYMFNIVDPSINKNRTDWAKATDTSSINASFTENTGKPIFSMMGNTGASIAGIDSTGKLSVTASIGSPNIGHTTTVNYFTSTTGNINFGSGTNTVTNIYAKFVPIASGVTGGFGYTPYNIKGTGADSITAAGGIPATKLASEIRFNQAAAIDISANPQIADGFDGQIIEITGLSDVNTLKLDDGNGLQLAGGNSFTLGAGDVISLKYILSLDIWVERFRSDN